MSTRQSVLDDESYWSGRMPAYFSQCLSFIFLERVTGEGSEAEHQNRKKCERVNDTESERAESERQIESAKCQYMKASNL